MADQKKNTHDWRAGAATPAGRKGPSKAVNLFTGILLAGALAGSIVGLYFWLGGDVGPRFISIPMSDLNRTVWPPVPYAEADAEKIVKNFDASTRELATNSRENERYILKLQSLSDLRSRALVLHVSGLAVADGDKVYLIGLKADPGKIDDSWHSIDELLDAVRKCPASEKLLILDIARPLADPARGILADRAMAVLHDKLEAASSDPKLGLVLVSAGPGEFSQVLDEQKATAFGYFLNQGLAGAADGFLDGTRDGRVRVRELAAYVKDHVSRWSFFARGMMQTPYLIGSGDFRLTVQASRHSPEKLEAKAPEYPKALADAWALRDALAVESAAVLAPHLVHRLQSGLVRTEDRLAAGVPDDRIASEVADIRNEVEPSWQRLRAVTPPAPLSLVGVRRPPGLAERMEGWLAGKAEQGQLIAASQADTIKASRPELIAIAWDKFRDVPVKREQVIAMVGEVVPAGASIDHAEVTLMLAAKKLAEEPIFKSDRPWPSDTILAACRAEGHIREALAAVTPEAFRWFREPLDQILQKRAEAESKLMQLSDSSLSNARTTAQQATKLFQEVDEAATSLRDDAQLADAAYRVLASAMVDLPGDTEWIIRLDRAKSGSGTETWNTAIDAASILANAFEQSGPFPREVLQTQTTRLRTAMDGLRSLLTGLQLGEPQFAIVQALLASPRLPAADRGKYWRRWRDTSAGKYNWLQDNEDKVSPATAGVAAFDASAEANRAARRAGIGLELVRLANVPNGKLGTHFQELRGGSNPATWDVFGRDLMLLLTPPIQPSAGAARMSRVFGTTDEAARVACTVRANFWSWLAERYDSEGSLRGPGSAAFYRKAAKESREAAGRARTAGSVSAAPSR